jgi:hypothetical protein
MFIIYLLLIYYLLIYYYYLCKHIYCWTLAKRTPEFCVFVNKQLILHIAIIAFPHICFQCMPKCMLRKIQFKCFLIILECNVNAPGLVVLQLPY